MPYRGSFGVAMALHVLTAVFVIGPLGVATLTAPMLLRAKCTGIGADAGAGGVAGSALPAVRVAVRSIRWLTLASVVVAGFGFAILKQGSFGSVREVTDPWVFWSVALWAVALVINLVPLDRTLSRAADTLDAGGDARGLAPVVAAAGVASSMCWVLIVILMVIKPGA
jgi:hypothetical protein